jgi:ABC-type phosphate/phosphonate transport system substrate-binding protein
MTIPIMNARMYAVTPEVEAGWQALLRHVTAAAGVTFDYVAYPAPQPLEHLWSRPELGCVFMCGYPIALKLAPVIPIAAPIPSAPWAEGRPLYRSDLIVRADSHYQSLEDTFGGRAGWTVEHSHSGFNALRHHLLAYRTPARERLYGAVTGHLVTARKIVDCILDGTIDVGPLDAYWHVLLRQYHPELAADLRVLESTALAPIPTFVAAAALPRPSVEALRRAFVACAERPWFGPYRQALAIRGFAAVKRSDYLSTLAWRDDAERAGYPCPA